MKINKMVKRVDKLGEICFAIPIVFTVEVMDNLWYLSIEKLEMGHAHVHFDEAEKNLKENIKYLLDYVMQNTNDLDESGLKYKDFFKKHEPFTKQKILQEC